MIKLVIVFIAFLASALSTLTPNGTHHSPINGAINQRHLDIVVPSINYAAHVLHHGKDHYVPTYYDFDYGVNDPHHGVSFGHNENKEGHKTSGSYYVLLPDNKLQTVGYYADHTGYHPTVTYI